MGGAQLLVSHAVMVAILVALVGLVATRRFRECWSLTAYLVVVLATASMIAFWPDRFYNYYFYTGRQAVFDVLKLCVALEISRKVFASFPGALSRWRVVSFVVLVVTTAAVVGASWNDPVVYAAYHWQPRISAGAAWILCAIALVVGWHRLPIDAWHYAILVGFIPYLVVFSTTMTLITMRWSAWYAIGLVDSVAYLALMIWWAYAAWRPPEVLSPAGGRVAPAFPREQGA